MKYYRNKPFMIEAVQVKDCLELIAKESYQEMPKWIVNAVWKGQLHFSQDRAYISDKNSSIRPEDYLILSPNGQLEYRLELNFLGEYYPCKELDPIGSNYLKDLVGGKNELL